MEPTGRKCEICQKDDMDAFVVASGICAMSFNTCSVCMAIGAEQNGMQDVLGEYVTYDDKNDRYYDAEKKSITIETKSGRKFKTRSEFVTFHKNEARQKL